MKFVDICSSLKCLLGAILYDAVDLSQFGPGITAAKQHSIRFRDGTVIIIMYLGI